MSVLTDSNQLRRLGLTLVGRDLDDVLVERVLRLAVVGVKRAIGSLKRMNDEMNKCRLTALLKLNCYFSINSSLN